MKIKLIYFILLMCINCYKPVSELYLGMGAKVGEITNNSVIVHVRLTSIPEQNADRLLPGKAGEARVKYGLSKNLKGALATDWLVANEEDDFSIQFNLHDLKPNQNYYYKVEMRTVSKERPNESKMGYFKTAPQQKKRERVKFQVTTGQDYRGLDTYIAMASQDPDFLVSTGDNVYYDWLNDQARNIHQAYEKYQKMYAAKQIVEYFRKTGCYFMKDDHDYRFDDSDPYMKGRYIREPYLIPGISKVTDRKGEKYFDETWLTHEEGIMVFKTVFPMSDKTYRTFSWGQGVQIWFLEGRDFRSPNSMPDGPNKTIWGQEQKNWLKRTLLRSDADFRIVISPTPIIGPDRQSKKDNHANRNGFWTEGRNFLKWIIDNKLDNLIIICGDRHWQYHSIYENSVHEFSCGPICDEHSVRDKPNQIVPRAPKEVQPYYNLCGGFLTVEYLPEKMLEFSFFGESGECYYEASII